MVLQVFVRSAFTGETVSVDVEDYTTVGDLKFQLCVRQGLAQDEHQLLTFGLRNLHDEFTLAECGVESESTLFQSLALLGGGKKRKKKQYTKPKKTKHKKKKVKLSILKFYKLDSNEKVSRLRKECPADSCGPGVFMALHHNRTYCGRCGLTYIMKKEEEA
eukprot:GHVS01057828.1.p1 GENE.GHVS01057828.1~~GHVS01057828.1.p1  ORF type:complete len:161 (+),score=19.13 GHVS01057828.1:250-732(+)